MQNKEVEQGPELYSFRSLFNLFSFVSQHATDLFLYTGLPFSMKDAEYDAVPSSTLRRGHVIAEDAFLHTANGFHSGHRAFIPHVSKQY
jgi:hypothetical protein